MGKLQNIQGSIINKQKTKQRKYLLDKEKSKLFK